MSLTGAAKKKNSLFSSHKAFTLLELIIVIAIIAVLVGGSAPLFRRTLNDLQLSEAADRFTALLSFAKQMAVLKRTEYKVNIDSDNDTYGLQDDKVHTTPRFIDIESDAELISFYADGTSIDAAVSFANDKKALTVRVDSVSGDIQLTDDKE